MPSTETWRLDPDWGTTIMLDGCHCGLTVDGRCDELHCQYRTTSDRCPDTIIEPMALLCPRDKELVKDVEEVEYPF